MTTSPNDHDFTDSTLTDLEKATLFNGGQEVRFQSIYRGYPVLFMKNGQVKVYSSTGDSLDSKPNMDGAVRLIDSYLYAK